jgi:hypothetical protein
MKTLLFVTAILVAGAALLADAATALQPAKTPATSPVQAAGR